MYRQLCFPPNLLVAILIVLASTMIFFSGCTFDKGEIPVTPEFCDSLQISYADHIVPIIESNCSSVDFGFCHIPLSGNPVIGDHSSLVATVETGAFEIRVMQQRNMPPSNTQGPDSLSQHDLDVIQCWLDAGHPNN